MKVARKPAAWIAMVAAALSVIGLLVVIGLDYDRTRQDEANERAAIRASSAVQTRIDSAAVELKILADAIGATGGDEQAFESASESLLSDPSVLKVSFLEGDQSGVGVNVGSDPVRRAAIDEAARTGEPTLTAPVSLIQTGKPGTLVYAPVFEGSAEELEGFAVGIYDLKALTDSIEALIPGTRVSLTDEGQTIVAGDMPEDAAVQAIPVAGRTWDLMVKAPKPVGLALALFLPGLGALVMAGVATVLSLARRRERYATDEAELQRAQRDFAEEQRVRTEEDFSATFEESPVGIAIIGLDGRFTSVNRSLCELVERSPQELREATAPRLIQFDEDTKGAVKRMLSGEARHHRAETSYTLRDGERIWLAINAVICRNSNGEPLHFLCHVEDVSDRHLLQQHLEALADCDELTGLRNRRGFGRELQRKLYECERYEPTGALLLIDLDELKKVNDEFGHARGDEMLKAAGEALRAGSRKSDVVGRIGGDEFAIIMPQGTSGDAQHAAEAVLARLLDERRPGDQQPLSASIGIVAFQDLTVFSQEAALNAADLAMYEAKRAGGRRLELWAK